MVNRPSLTLTRDLLGSRTLSDVRSRRDGDSTGGGFDDPAGMKTRQLLPCEAQELREHAIGVLTEQRRGPLDTAGGAAVQANGRVRHQRLAPTRVIDLRPVAAGSQ